VPERALGQVSAPAQEPVLAQEPVQAREPVLAQARGRVTEQALALAQAPQVARCSQPAWWSHRRHRRSLPR
jgi:hypothetical protein